MAQLLPHHTTNALYPDLSIVIPAFNEALRIGDTLESLCQFLTNQTHWHRPEIIIVCDGGTDATEDIVRQHSFFIPNMRCISYSRNRGKGYALKTGIMSSQGGLVLITDADLSTPLEEVLRLAEIIEKEDAGIVIGSRRIETARITQSQPLHRRFLGTALSLLTRTVTNLPFKDTQCGFKLFSGPVARQLFADLQCDHFGYDLHILHKAITSGIRVQECGVEWADRPGSHVRPFTDGCKILATAWSVRFRSSTWARIVSWIKR